LKWDGCPTKKANNEGKKDYYGRMEDQEGTHGYKASLAIISYQWIIAEYFLRSVMLISF
jgi:hypothetical protein